MSDRDYFTVPLGHLTSPTAPPVEPKPPEPPIGLSEGRPSTEPWGMLDVVEPPETYGVDEVTLLARDPFTLFVHWEVTLSGRARAGADAAGAALVLRLHIAAGRHAGPAQVIDERLTRDFGRGYLPAPYPGAFINAAIGIRSADGGFTPIAGSPALRVPYAGPEDGPVEWMEVAPARTRGLRFEPPTPAQRGPAELVPGAAHRTLPGSGPPGSGPSSADTPTSSPTALPTSPTALPTSPTRSGQ